MEQWNSDGGTVMVEQCGGTVWWNTRTVIVEQCGGTVEQCVQQCCGTVEMEQRGGTVELMVEQCW